MPFSPSEELLVAHHKAVKNLEREGKRATGTAIAAEVSETLKRDRSDAETFACLQKLCAEGYLRTEVDKTRRTGKIAYHATGKIWPSGLHADPRGVGKTSPI